MPAAVTSRRADRAEASVPVAPRLHAPTLALHFRHSGRYQLQRARSWLGGCDDQVGNRGSIAQYCFQALRLNRIRDTGVTLDGRKPDPEMVLDLDSA